MREKNEYFSLDRIISFGLLTLLFIAYVSPWLINAWSIGISYDEGFNGDNCFNFSVFIHLFLFTILPKVNYKNRNFVFILDSIYLIVAGALTSRYYLRIEGIEPSNFYIGFYLSFLAYIGMLLHGLFCMVEIIPGKIIPAKIFCHFGKESLAEEPVKTHSKDRKYFSRDRIISFGLLTLLLIAYLSPWYIYDWNIQHGYKSGFAVLKCYELVVFYLLIQFTVLPDLNFKNRNFIYILGSIYLMVEGYLSCSHYLGIEGFGMRNFGTGFYLSFLAYIGILIYGVVKIIEK